MRRIAIVGLGDLGRRIALGLAQSSRVDAELLLCGRDREAGSRLRFFLVACHSSVARYVPLDALDTEAVGKMLGAERPAVLVQCATLLSPWHLPGRSDPVARAILGGGFALQLSAQLPIALSVAQAVHRAAPETRVVNCSYPDVVNPILARLGEGLAPLLGIGNAGMIEGCARASLERQDQLVRVVAHHGHVTPVAKADPTLCGDCAHPMIFVGEDGRRADDLAFGGSPLPSDNLLNTLTAAHATRVIEALLQPERALRTSVPGPLGLPGGYPVRLGPEEVTLDLPPGLSESQAIAHNEASAPLDAVERIEPDGTVIYTASARAAVESLDPVLAAPLPPDEALSRFAHLRAVLQP